MIIFIEFIYPYILALWLGCFLASFYLVPKVKRIVYSKRLMEAPNNRSSHQKMPPSLGGITEETTVMGIPCMTLRDNTERPETITEGTNELLGTDPKAIAPAMQKLLSGNWKKGSIPKLWDGNTAERIVDILLDL